MSDSAVAVRPPEQRSIIATFANAVGLDPGKAYNVLKETIFKGGSDAQLQAFLTVCNQFRLNPFLKQIHAFPAKGGGIVPVVGIDGWISIVNDNSVFDGEEFEYGPTIQEGQHKGRPEYIQCTMFRKDRSHPTRIREYYTECYRNTDPWNQTGSRMLRHRAYIQCGRVCFGLSGIYDPDEADKIIEGDVRLVETANVADMNERLRQRAEASQQQITDDTQQQAENTLQMGEIIDGETGEITRQEQPNEKTSEAESIHATTLVGSPAVAVANNQAGSAPADSAGQTATGGDQAPAGDATQQGLIDDAPILSFAELVANFQAAKSLDDLLVWKDHIQRLPVDQQGDAAAEFNRIYKAFKAKK